MVPKDTTDKIAGVPTDLECRAIVAVVPILYAPNESFNWAIVVYAVVIPCVIFIFIYLVNLRKGKVEIPGLYATRVLLGQSVNRLPDKVSNRLVYLTVVIVYVFVSIELVSEVVNFNFGQQEVPFDSFDDLDRSKLEINAPDDLFLFKFASEDKVQNSLDLKLRYRNECLTHLTHTRDHACIIWKYEADVFIELNRNPDGSPILKIANPPYFCDPMYFRFEPASPYLKRFETVNRRVRESDLVRMAYLMGGFFKRIHKYEIIEEADEKNPWIQLIFVLIVGYSTSLLIFIHEFCRKNTFSHLSRIFKTVYSYSRKIRFGIWNKCGAYLSF